MTEAPWNVSGRQKKTQIGGFSVITAPGGAAIAYVAYDDDARLIAAAPELLEALKAIQAMAEQRKAMIRMPDGRGLCNFCRHAIAQAEGVK